MKFKAKTAIQHATPQMVKAADDVVPATVPTVHMFQPGDPIPDGLLTDEDITHFLEVGAIEEHVPQAEIEAQEAKAHAEAVKTAEAADQKERAESLKAAKAADAKESKDEADAKAKKKKPSK